MNMPPWVPWVQLLIEIATLVLVAIYVHKTWQMASSTRAAAEATARATEEATRARIDSMAPRVIAYFEYATHLATIVIENVGHGTACDVSYKFEPPLSGTRADLIPKFFDRPTPILGPGQRLATFFDSWPAYFRADLPRQYKLHLSFVGIENRQRYTSVIMLDADPIAGYFFTGRKDINDAVKELEQFRADLSKSLSEIANVLEMSHELSKFPSPPATFAETLQTIITLWSVSSRSGRGWSNSPNYLGMRSALQKLSIHAVVQADASGTASQRVVARKLCTLLHDHRQRVLGPSTSEWEGEIDDLLRAVGVAETPKLLASEVHSEA